MDALDRVGKMIDEGQQPLIEKVREKYGAVILWRLCLLSDCFGPSRVRGGRVRERLETLPLDIREKVEPATEGQVEFFSARRAIMEAALEEDK